MVKTLLKILVPVIFLTGAASCAKKNCSGPCASNQECYEGACVCTDGTEGTNCLTYSYEKYERSYYVSEACAPPEPYGSANVFIQHNPNNISQLLIYNLFYGSCSYIIAVIHTNGSNLGDILEIPSQNANCAGNTVSGVGSYDEANHRITLQLDFVANGTDYQCTETLY
ncbi:MAG TPA: hypothetical protein VG603_08895 [Chitinophagales bacterium]|nr:hypothetical protein [Chitinophagales bacterium]